MLRSIFTTTAFLMALLAAEAPRPAANLNLTDYREAASQVSLIAAAGTASLHLTTQESRLVSFQIDKKLEFHSSTGQSIESGAWYAVCGEVTLTVSKATAGLQLAMDVGEPDRPHSCTSGKTVFVPVKQIPSPPYRSFDIFLTAAPRAARPPGAQPGRNPERNSEAPSLWSSLRLPAAIFGAILCLCLLGWFLWRRPAQQGHGLITRPGAGAAAGQQRGNLDPAREAAGRPLFSSPGASGRSFADPAATIDAADLEDRLTRIEGKLNRIDAQSRTLRIDPAELENQLRAGGLDATINGIRGDIDKTMAQVQVVQAGLSSAAPRSQVVELQRSLGETGEALQRIEKESRQKLQTALSVLAERYLCQQYSASVPPGSDERAVIGQRMEEALTDFFRSSAPDKNSLCARRESLRRLAAVIEDLRNELRRISPDSTERMNPPLGEARRVLDDLDDTIAMATSQKLHLRFEADFSTSAASRETLGEAIAAGLGDQIVRLQRPIEYFDRRIQAVALTSSQAAADFVDLNPGDHRDAALEAKLQTLIGAAGIETIVPAAGEPFRAGEHAVVQTLPTADRRIANTVARLVTRGFRKDGRVFRKASVILYE